MSSDTTANVGWVSAGGCDGQVEQVVGASGRGRRTLVASMAKFRVMVSNHVTTLPRRRSKTSVLAKGSQQRFLRNLLGGAGLTHDDECPPEHPTLESLDKRGGVAAGSDSANPASRSSSESPWGACVPAVRRARGRGSMRIVDNWPPLQGLMYRYIATLNLLEQLRNRV